MVGNAIYPAHAGINLAEPLPVPVSPNLPRTRGDKPHATKFARGFLLSTPHTRG